MKRRSIMALALMMVIAMLLAACGSSNTAAPAASSEPAASEEPAEGEAAPSEPAEASADSGQDAAADASVEKPKVALLLTGSRGDFSFLDSAYAGMEMVAEKHGIEFKAIEMGPDSTKYETNLLDASEEDYDIIIGSGWQMQEPIQNVANDYPDKHYIIFDAAVDYAAGGYENVYSITYLQNEGSFLAGVLAANLSETGTIGFIGGADGPGINDFMFGYIEGALYKNPDIKVLSGYVGDFVDSPKCKTMALAQYDQGTDVLFTAAGAAGLGTLDAAKEVDKWAIGVDSDQAMMFDESDKEKANHIPTSMMKRVDNSLLRAFDLIMQGENIWGRADALGLADDAVGLSENSYYETLVPEDVRNEIETVKGKVISGEITVGTAFGKDNSEVIALLDSVKP